MVSKFSEWKILFKHHLHVQKLKLGWDKNPTSVELDKTFDDTLPMPPPYLIYLVGANTDINQFLHGGIVIAKAIQGVLSKNGRKLIEMNSILDFGCGCGRVVRQWKDLNGPMIFGTDYESAAIRWCRQNLPFAHFDTNNLQPPLKHTGERFDFIYAFSVFTHLTEELQVSWMDEFRRLLTPGGFLLISTHGESFTHVLSGPKKELFNRGELVVLSKFAAGTNLTASFHPEKFVHEILAKGLTIVDFVPQGARQDFWLFRK